MKKHEKKIQEKFFRSYFSNISELLERIDHKKLIKISNFIEKIINYQVWQQAIMQNFQLVKL